MDQFSSLTDFLARAVPGDRYDPVPTSRGRERLYFVERRDDEHDGCGGLVVRGSTSHRGRGWPGEPRYTCTVATVEMRARGGSVSKRYDLRFGQARELAQVPAPRFNARALSNLHASITVTLIEGYDNVLDVFNGFDEEP